MKRLLILLLILLTACAAPQRQPLATPMPVVTASYYVSTSGNDANGCTQSAPCKTITRGIAIAKAGDAVLVSAGTYRENVNVNKSISLKAVGSVIIDGTNLPVQNGGGLINIQSLTTGATVEGFEVMNGGTYGISVFGNSNKIVSNKIHNIRGAGIWMRDGKYNLFENNELYFSVLQNSVSFDGVRYTCSPTTTGWASAINSWGAAGSNTWRGNYIHDNCGEGIVSHSWDVIENNTFEDNWSVEIYIDESTDVIVRNNTIINTRPYFPRGSNQSWRQVSYGIAVADEINCLSDRNTITGNTVTGARYGFSFYPYSSCSGLKNTVIDNNNFINSWEYGIRIMSGAHANTFVRNNVISSASGSPYTIPASITFVSNIGGATSTPIPPTATATPTKTPVPPTATSTLAPATITPTSTPAVGGSFIIVNGTTIPCPCSIQIP